MNEERKKYPRTAADVRAENLADRADEGGLWEGIRPFERPIKLGYLERRRMIKNGHVAIKKFLGEQVADQDNTGGTLEDGYDHRDHS